MTTTWRVVAAILFILFLVTLGVLVEQQQGGPPHGDFDLPGNEPATLFLPGAPGPIFTALTLQPKAIGERPPGVVLVHGYSGDRAGMSRLARRMAQNGYAVLTIDLHGHGQNRNPFANSFAGQPEPLRGDIKNAVDYMRNSQLVDPARIIVAGHSMGAGAALDYAEQDSGLAGSVMISGGFSLWGQNPRNALFIFAQHDPPFIAMLSRQIAAKLVPVDQVEEGKLYGDFAKGSAVEVVNVAGVDHGGIISSPEAARMIIEWLDSASGMKRAGELNLADPRRATTGIALLLFVTLLVPFGRLVAGLAPAWPRREGAGAWAGLCIVTIALVAAVPMSATALPAQFLSIEVVRELFSWLLVAGILMTLWLVLRHSIDWPLMREGMLATFFAAVLAVALLYIVWQPMSVTMHNLSFTPERSLGAAFSMLVVLPFFMAFELLVRRGSLLMSTTASVIGRLIIVVLVFVLAVNGFLPFVVSLFAIPLGIVFVMFEIFAASVYSASANLVLIALVESSWLAWMFAVCMPVRIFI